jgi:hypothetical protein
MDKEITQIRKEIESIDMNLNTMRSEGPKQR